MPEVFKHGKHDVISDYTEVHELMRFKEQGQNHCHPKDDSGQFF